VQADRLPDKSLNVNFLSVEHYQALADLVLFSGQAGAVLFITLDPKLDLWQNWTPGVPCSDCATATGLL
jgi:hypothetical protein